MNIGHTKVTIFIRETVLKKSFMLFIDLLTDHFQSPGKNLTIDIGTLAQG